MKKNLFLLAISSLSLFARAMDDEQIFARAMDDEQRIVTTTPVFRLEGEKLRLAGFRLDQAKRDKTARDLNKAFIGASTLRTHAFSGDEAGVGVEQEALKKAAAAGNLRAALVFAPSKLCLPRSEEQDEAYAFLEKGLALDDHPWRTPEQCRTILGTISGSETYQLLKACEQSGDTRASYALGDIMLLIKRLGHKADWSDDSQPETSFTAFGVDCYQRALTGVQLSDQQRESAVKKWGEMATSLIETFATLPLDNLRKFLQQARALGVSSLESRLAALLIARGDATEKKGGTDT